MPEVKVRFDANALQGAGGGLISASEAISKIIAKELDCSDVGGELLPEHIDVAFERFGNRDKTNGFSAIVTIAANYFPNREERLSTKNSQAANSIRRLFKPLFKKGSKIAIWTRLSPGAFTEFEI
ncbi:MAG: hypothetical protein WCV58_03980 [Patescibacteria group bacterium]